MDAPLAQCTREEQRAVVRFLWSEGSSGTKIHQRLLAQYGDNALSKTTVYEWIEKFKTGRYMSGLRSLKFSSDESVQKAVHQWLCDQPKTFFSDGIYKLVDRWNKCIEMGGDYVEK